MEAIYFDKLDKKHTLEDLLKALGDAKIEKVEARENQSEGYQLIVDGVVCSELCGGGNQIKSVVTKPDLRSVEKHAGKKRYAAALILYFLNNVTGISPTYLYVKAEDGLNQKELEDYYDRFVYLDNKGNRTLAIERTNGTPH